MDKQNLQRKKILVIRFSSLGDVVLTTALFPNLRHLWPDAEINVLTNEAYAAIFDNNPFVDHVWVMNPDKQSFSQLTKEIRQRNYDVIIDLQVNPKSWLIRLVSGPPVVVTVDKCTWARRGLILFKRKNKSLERSVRERILDCLKPLEAERISDETQLFPKNGDDILKTFSIDSTSTLIGIAPGAQHKTKRWFPVRFAEAANRLGAIHGSTVLLLGNKNDRAVAQQIQPLIKVPFQDLTGWTSVAELVAIMSKLSFLLTNDSGIMHIGDALSVPLVSLFGPTVRGFGFAPYRKSSRVVEVVNLPCRPCTLHGDEQCPLGHHKCMDDIDLNAVLYAASSVFSAPSLPLS